jgi:hypothetical protein
VVAHSSLHNDVKSCAGRSRVRLGPNSHLAVMSVIIKDRLRAFPGSGRVEEP